GRRPALERLRAGTGPDRAALSPSGPWRCEVKPARIRLWAAALTCAALATNAAAQPKPGAPKPGGKAAAVQVAAAAAAPKAKGKADVEEKTIAVVGATVYTGDGEPIEDG